MWSHCNRLLCPPNQSDSNVFNVSGSISAGGLFGLSPGHHRMSSLDSTTSDESSIPTPHNSFGSVSSLISGQNNLKDHYGSITSLASSTSLISPQVQYIRHKVNKAMGSNVLGIQDDLAHDSPHLCLTVWLTSYLTGLEMCVCAVQNSVHPAQTYISKPANRRSTVH